MLWLGSIPKIYSQSNSSGNQLTNLYKSASLDTARLLSDKPLKSPMGAVLRSAVLPGWGQFYTKHYFKAGLAFPLNATLAYYIYDYNRRYHSTNNTDFRNKRNLYTWYFALAYLVTMADAYVDAYLYKFNLALELAQNDNRTNSIWYPQLSVSFHF